MKLDIEKIAKLMVQLSTENDYSWDDAYEISVIEILGKAFKEQCIERSYELEHPKPKTREEYNERYGIGEGELE